MSSYYYDCEFLEGTQKKLFGRTKPTIDLISIGIVSEDGREYYAISKDFNLKEAWNRFDLERQSGDMKNQFSNGKKVYWIRENVLKPIYLELHQEVTRYCANAMLRANVYIPIPKKKFTYRSLKKLIKQFGKSNNQIAAGIVEFVNYIHESDDTSHLKTTGIGNKRIHKNPTQNQFYAYYGAYDHVALCWLFGKMIDLPKGFPMISFDLKQMLDDKLERTTLEYYGEDLKINTLEGKLKIIKARVDFPTQQNAHNALHDAKWNKKLHEFIQSL